MFKMVVFDTELETSVENSDKMVNGLLTVQHYYRKGKYSLERFKRKCASR